MSNEQWMALSFVCMSNVALQSVPKYRCPKWFGATGCNSDVRIFISGNAAITVLAACGVQKRFDRIIEDSLTPCSFNTFTA